MAKRGFFSRTETASLSIGKQVLSCPSCGLYKNCQSPRMEPCGEGKKRILIIGEKPEEADDQKNALWQTKNGRLLARILKKYGIDLYEDCKSINAISCFSFEEPSEHAVNCCRARVWQVIKDFNPSVIIPLGDAAVQTLIAHRWKEDIGKIDKWRGWQIPDRETKCWICPSLAIPFVNEYKNHLAKTILEDDLKKAVQYAEETYLYSPEFSGMPDEASMIQYLPESDKADKILMDFFKTKPDLIAFDYETTGLKPYGAGHKIACCSVATNDQCFALWYPYGFNALQRILRSKTIQKTAHNIKFERIWTRVILGYDVQNWGWDSMASSRIMDNGRGVSGLKFQVYVNFGIADYDSKIGEFLKGEEKGNGNAFNQVFKAPRKELLKYCGLDSIFGYKLSIRHQHFLGYK